MSSPEVEDDGTWIIELEAALMEECTPAQVWKVANGRCIPESLRPEVWQACLGVHHKESPLQHFSDVFDMPEQSMLRTECQLAVAKLGNEDEDKVSVISDLESILTCYCKTNKLKYEKDNGWIDMLIPLLSLKLATPETYNLFAAIQHQYIPRRCKANGEAFHLLRLLLQYHDPELCSFLDTKRISPDTYCMPWFESVFATTCNLPALLAMWDYYFQLADPFFIFFLALVMVVNAREQVLSMKDESRSDIVDTLMMMPCELASEDTADFCSLAQYYAVKTPISFRKELSDTFFSEGDLSPDSSVAHMLCLPVYAHEILYNPSDGVRFFLVDCRPVEQYNAGHLPTAFHLDCNLMLQEPAAFATAVQGLLSGQQQALASRSAAGGDHLCFLGSGREVEDQYTHMVVASFLQKHINYVSMLAGGYQAVHELVEEDQFCGLDDHCPQSCLVCNTNDTASEENSDAIKSSNSSYELFSKIGAAMKSKSAEVKEKLIDYIVNPAGPAAAERHVKHTDKVGRRYRNMAPVFSIDDDDEEAAGDASSVHSLEDDERQEVVSVQTWLKKSEVVSSFLCQEVKMNGYVYNSHLLVTDSHIYVLRDIPERKGFAHIAVQRPICEIVRITSKKKHPQLITFKYGTSEGDKPIISDMDRFLIPEASQATNVISQQIMKQLKTH